MRRSRRIASLAATVALITPTTASAALDSTQAPVTRLVMFERDATAADVSALHEAAGATVTGTLPEVSVSRVVMPPAALELYERSPVVAAVQKPTTFRVMGSTPNDPLLNLQWPLRQIGAFKAWGIETGKKASVPVAVIDTGVDAMHSDLQGRIVPGFDFLELDEDPYDDHGHGTHVSGIIAANVSNREGIVGLNHGSDIIPMKACTDRGSCDLFPMYAGVIDAVRRGARVINMSLGAPTPCSQIEQSVFDWVRSQGVLAVVSAGNSGATKKNPSMSPANCDYTLGVGAVNPKGKWAKFSSYGDWVDIAAPGVQVWSTLPPLISIMSPHIGYGPASGTSMAAPHVAGAASLVMARHPDWTPEQVQDKLIGSATDAGPKGRDDRYGHGLLNLYAALR